MTHICVSELTIIGSYNGLSPDRRQAIIWTIDGILNLKDKKYHINMWYFLSFKFKGLHDGEYHDTTLITDGTLKVTAEVISGNALSLSRPYWVVTVGYGLSLSPHYNPAVPKVVGGIHCVPDISRSLFSIELTKDTHISPVGWDVGFFRVFKV